MHVNYRNSAETDKKCHCSRTIITAEVIVGEFYCSSYSDALAYCHVFHIFMTYVDPVKFIQIYNILMEVFLQEAEHFRCMAMSVFFHMGGSDAP